MRLIAMRIPRGEKEYKQPKSVSLPKTIRKDLILQCRVCGRSVIFGIGSPKKQWKKRKEVRAFHSGKLAEGYSEVTNVASSTRRRARRKLEQNCYRNHEVVRQSKTNLEIAEALEEAAGVAGIGLKIGDLAKMHRREFWETALVVYTKAIEKLEGE